MEIFISKIKAEGLRCPDIELNFKDNISLVQMPNGTGKTTLLELIKSTLTGKNHSSKEILDLQNPQDKSIEEGFFELELSLKESKKSGKVIIRSHFHFFNRQNWYETNKDDFNNKFLNSNVADGFITSHAPPEEIKPFLLDDIVDLFVLEGSYVKSLLDDKKELAERAIDAFTGINAIKEAKGNVDNFYRKISRTSRGGQANDKKLTDVLKKLKQLDGYIPKLQERVKKLKTTQKEKAENHEKLKAEIEASQLDQAALSDLKNSLVFASEELNQASVKLFTNLQNPLSINEKIRKGLNEFNNILGKLKLPGDATESFFKEICQNPECICGIKMNSEMIQHINKNSESYFSGPWQSSLNSVKRDLSNFEEAAEESPMEEDLISYEESRKKYNKASNALQRYSTNITGKTDKNLDKKITQLSDLAIALGKLEKDIEEMELDNEKPVKDSISYFDSNNIQYLKNIPELIRIQDYYEDLKADHQGNKKLKDSVNLLKQILESTITHSRETINQRIVTDINSKIAQLMPGDESLQVESIDGNLILTKSRASQGQNLALAYSFVMALLDRSEHDFPLIVDHPFEGLQQESRNLISQLLPKVCNQYLGFLINAEKWGSLLNPSDLANKGFRLSNAEITYLTAFRKTKATELLIKDNDPNLFILSKNGVVCDDKNFFDEFTIESLQEG